MKQEQSKKLLLMDGHSILNRAFFGIPDLTNSAGVHTNAVYGFLNILFKLIETEQPDYLTVAFDEHAPTFRHEMYQAYKGTRKPMAEELRQQVPMIKEMLQAMGVTILSKPGLEADDLLGTMARMGEEQGLCVTIVSGDRDLLQLATEKVKISIPKTKKTGTEIEQYYAKDVKERYQVTPKEFIDVKALMGDTADNIPGVPGIGEKTATAIIAQYHCIEEAYAHCEELKPPRASKNLQEFYEQAKLSKTLATIEVEAEIDYEVTGAELKNLFTQEAYELCRKWEFKNLLGRFDRKAPVGEMERSFLKHATFKELSDFVEGMIREKKQRLGIYFISEDNDETGEVEKTMEQLSLFAAPKEERKSDIRIRCMAVSDGEHTLFLGKDQTGDFSCMQEQFSRLAKHSVQICGANIKEFIKVFAPEQKERPYHYENTFDVTVADYLLHPLKNEYLLEDMAGEYLQMSVPSYAELFSKQTVFQAEEQQTETFANYACYQAYIAQALVVPLRENLRKSGMERLYQEIELPLVFTLADMELEGIAIDGTALKEYGDKLSERLCELEQNIYEQAGESFNINSPKQLGVILFEKMGMPGGKKTKTGYSTAADVLENLAADVPIVANVLEYRQLAKLKSTYAEGLTHCIQKDGRIRSSFQQTVTATGRISSTEPNLQNIPIRMELGKWIRKVFYPKAGYVFVDADYSQIELRVLSHMSGDNNLIQAFLRGQDIHRATAALVFQTPFEEVTQTQRSNAKAVNFGIVYGISAFGLSRDLRIGKKEAQKYIDDYFLAYPKMKTFLDKLVQEGKEQGKVTTMYGRIRPIPELASGNFMQRQFGERIAMNSPIQGTAADIIKIAMVRVHDRLQSEGMESRLLLQVHDELLIEAKVEELERVKELLREEMQQAAKLAVPLEVDMHTGNTWYDAK